MIASQAAYGRVVSRIAGNYPLADTYHLSALASDMESMTPRVSELVRESTNLAFSGAPSTAVVGRVEWIERNARMFAVMIEPATKALEERLSEASTVRARKLLDAETATILAVLSKRVLGQYELVLPGSEDGDVVAYVGPNILEMERKHHFKPAEFRFWVALHEITHRAQFQGVPWLRDYFLSLVHELVEHARPEAGRLSRIWDEVELRRSAGEAIIDDRGLFGLLGTPEQNQVLDKVQALMSVLEGHGHVVMDRVGAEHLRTQDRMSLVLKERRADKRTQAFFRITGLEMKMKQYRLGEQFILAVEREAGWESLNLAFRSAEDLPTLEEIENPGAWLTRVG